MMVKLANCISLKLASFHELQMNCQNLKKQNHFQTILILIRKLAINTHAYKRSHLMAYISVSFTEYSLYKSMKVSELVESTLYYLL